MQFFHTESNDKNVVDVVVLPNIARCCFCQSSCMSSSDAMLICSSC